MASRAIVFVIAFAAALLIIGGCPASEPPEDEPPPEGPPPNTPAVPLPTYAGESLPATSELLVYQETDISDFKPQLDHVPPLIVAKYQQFYLHYDPHPLQKLLVDDGVKTDPVLLHIHGCVDPNCLAYVDINEAGPPLKELPKVRWVRYWKRLVSVVIPYPTSYQQSHTYTEGTSETTGESFSITLGLSASGWGLGLSAELSYMFSHEVTISSESSVTKTFTCESEAGKQIQFTVWQLVEGFRICNSDGTPFTDPEYDFWSALGIDNETDQLYMSVVKFPE